MVNLICTIRAESKYNFILCRSNYNVFTTKFNESDVICKSQVERCIDHIQKYVELIAVVLVRRQTSVKTTLYEFNYHLYMLI